MKNPVVEINMTISPIVVTFILFIVHNIESIMKNIFLVGFNRNKNISIKGHNNNSFEPKIFIIFFINTPIFF
ncbi:hypothetical protein SPM_000800 [Spiroplasma melliferum KC3]|uniref:Uncharacterized protein n=1 Tax=Spiroplasma melliferum KC3 TaxID=570509 RepID=A0AAI9T422_SPIME|nr:hypothetical protein SPM_000800 [Spiroplasma melliferum KC3]